MSTVIDTASTRDAWEIESDFVREILSPYKDHATYLRSAFITDGPAQGTLAPRRDAAKKSLMTAFGEFAIPESCYIDDTGHFNAVEFNICYNQIAYVLFAECFRKRLLHRLAPSLADKLSMDYDGYRHHQLSSMFIVKYQSKFKQPIDSDLFHGELSVQRVSSMADTFFAHTHIAFSDAGGGYADGSVLLAFSATAAH
ncbi:MAG: FcoT family thioesterase [Gammaproteobacteria bacterium]|jgi:hypothetical protein